VLAVLAGLALAFGRWLRQALRATLTAWQRDLRSSTLGRREIAGVLGYSALIWTEDLLRMLAAGAAFDVALSIPQASALAVTAILGGFAPTVGGLGAVEGGLIGGLVLFGVPLETAIAVTTVERLASYGFSTVTGGLTVAALGGRTLLRAALGRAGNA
jgi:undecaprenyl-diphosphatase